MATRLDYNNGVGIIPEGTMRINASAIRSFFTYTAGWFEERLYGVKQFTGSTASVLGTCVHFYAEDYFTEHPDSPLHSVDLSEIARYIASQERELGSDPEQGGIDVGYIHSQYDIMGQALIEHMSTSVLNSIYKTEEFISQEVRPNIHVGGSVDCLLKLYDGTFEVVDYKTTSALTLPSKISPDYKKQLHTYAMIYRDMGYDITSIKIVYVTTNTVGRISEKTGRALKDYPTQVVELREPFTDIEYESIKNEVELIAETVAVFIEQPNLRHILAQNYHLKNDNREPLCTPKTEEVSLDDI